MNVKDNIWACYCNPKNLYFNVSITSREFETSRLGLVSVSSFYVSCPSLLEGHWYCFTLFFTLFTHLQDMKSLTYLLTYLTHLQPQANN